MKPDLSTALVALLLASALLTTCGWRDDGAASEPASGTADGALQGTSVLSSFYGGDLAALRGDGPAEGVLVQSRGAAFITVGEYNAWLGTYPLSITSPNAEAARGEALEQMVTFKLIVQKARESGYQQQLESSGVRATEKSLALGYIRDWVTNTASVTDEQAREYQSRERDRLAQLDSSDIPGELKMMAIKGSVRGEQLTQQVKAWMEEAEIGYSRDLGTQKSVESL